MQRVTLGRPAAADSLGERNSMPIQLALQGGKKRWRTAAVDRRQKVERHRTPPRRTDRTWAYNNGKRPIVNHKTAEVFFVRLEAQFSKTSPFLAHSARPLAGQRRFCSLGAECRRQDRVHGNARPDGRAVRPHTADARLQSPVELSEPSGTELVGFSSGARVNRSLVVSSLRWALSCKQFEREIRLLFPESSSASTRCRSLEARLSIFRRLRDRSTQHANGRRECWRRSARAHSTLPQPAAPCLPLAKRSTAPW